MENVLYVLLILIIVLISLEIFVEVQIIFEEAIFKRQKIHLGKKQIFVLPVTYMVVI
jgi:hypothetical protein